MEEQTVEGSGPPAHHRVVVLEACTGRTRRPPLRPRPRRRRRSRAIEAIVRGSWSSEEGVRLFALRPQVAHLQVVETAQLVTHHVPPAAPEAVVCLGSSGRGRSPGNTRGSRRPPPWDDPRSRAAPTRVADSSRGCRSAPTSSGTDVRGRIQVRIRRVELPRAPADVGRGDPEGDRPRPRSKIADRLAVADRTGEGLGDRVVGDLTITGEPDECSPHLERLRSVDPFDLGRRFFHQRILNHRVESGGSERTCTRATESVRTWRRCGRSVPRHAACRPAPRSARPSPAGLRHP